MAGVRRAFVWATAGRYLVVAINLSATVVVARLVGPAGYGVSVLGGAAFAVAEAIRTIGGGAYLIQQGDLTLAKIRTSVTMSLVVTLVMTATLALLAKPLAVFYGAPGVEPYLRVTALAYLLGPLIYPIFALMSRELAFNRLATASVVMAGTYALTSVGLAGAGLDYMAFAWATVASAAVGSALCFVFRRDRSIYRPSFAEWRGVVRFGLFDSATALVFAAGEYAPYLVLGRFLPPADVGIAQRAVALGLAPERVVLAGVGAVALPALSRRAREKRDLKEAYLLALSLITAVQWPALLVLGLLAQPIVALIFGPRWGEVAPLLTILCVPLLLTFPGSLQYPLLVAVGAVRVLPPLVAVQAALLTGATFAAAPFGLFAIAWTLVAVVPISALAGVVVVRRFVGYAWAEGARALGKSAIVAGASAAGPAVLAWGSGARGALPIGAAAAALTLSALGWALGVWLTRHPIAAEIRRGIRAAMTAAAAGRG